LEGRPSDPLAAQGEALGVNEGEGLEWRRSCLKAGPWKMAPIARSTNSTMMVISVNRRTTAG